MKYHECDQIGNDLMLAAKATSKRRRRPCRLDLETGEWFVQEVERLHRKPYSLEDTIAYVLSGRRLSFVQREGYGFALKKIFARRRAAERDDRIARDTASDFPRGQEL